MSQQLRGPKLEDQHGGWPSTTMLTLNTSPARRLAIGGDVDVGSPGVSLAGNVEVNVVIDEEVVYTGDNEFDRMKREQCVMRRSNLQGVHEDYGGTAISSKMRCTRFEACGEDVNTTEHQ
jgi:hypothetical protein